MEHSQFTADGLSDLQALSRNFRLAAFLTKQALYALRTCSPVDIRISRLPGSRIVQLANLVT